MREAVAAAEWPGHGGSSPWCRYRGGRGRPRQPDGQVAMRKGHPRPGSPLPQICCAALCFSWARRGDSQCFAASVHEATRHLGSGQEEYLGQGPGPRILASPGPCATGCTVGLEEVRHWGGEPCGRHPVSRRGCVWAGGMGDPGHKLPAVCLTHSG